MKIEDIRDKNIEHDNPASKPIDAEPVTAEADAAANAAPNNLPSNPISTTPDLSAKRPARAAKTNGVEILSVESINKDKIVKNSSIINYFPPNLFFIKK